MLKTLKYKATADTPEVLFDISGNKFQLTGRSLPENTHDFYKPLIDWMNEYSSNPNPSTELEINLDYFNSSSIKQLLLIFMVLEKMQKNGNVVKVVWFYTEDDDLNKIKGKEFQSMLNLSFEFKILNT